MFTVSIRIRRELAQAIRDRYLAGSAAEKRRLLDAFVALTGYHRKHAIRVLRAAVPAPAARPPRPRVYDDAVRAALVVVWEASGRRCGKRLRPVLPILIPALEADGRLVVDEIVRGRLLAVSAATIDRLLASARASARGDRRRRRAGPRPPRRAIAGPTLEAVPAAPPRRAGPPPPRSWRTRADPFDGVWPHLVSWLEADPGRTARQLLQRLRDEGLGAFPERHLRTLQRRVKAWRRAGTSS